MTNIYVVTTLENYANGEAAYAVQHVYEGTVSVWTDHESGYGDAHETTNTIIELTPDNSGGFTQWYLSIKIDGIEYDNYA